MADLQEGKRIRCWGFHVWRTEQLGQYFEVPDVILGSAGGQVPGEKVCIRCGKRKRLRWRVGL